MPYDGEDNDTDSGDDEEVGEDSYEGADDGEDEEFRQFRNVGVPLLEDSSDDDCGDDDDDDEDDNDEDDDEEFVRPYYCDARKLDGCPICDDGVDGRCDDCVEQFRACRCSGRGWKPIEFLPELTMQLNEEPGAFRARGGRVPPMEVDYTDGHYGRRCSRDAHLPNMTPYWSQGDPEVKEELRLQHDVEEAYAEMGKKADGFRHGELANKAIIDNGCTSNVCSQDWLRCFENLSNKKFVRVPIEGHKKHFVFGAGKPKPEIYRAKLNLDLFGHRVEILTSVVEGDSTPFLISREQLAKWDAVIGVKDNELTLTIEGQLIKYVCPASSSNLMLLDLLGHKELRQWC